MKLDWFIRKGIFFIPCSIVGWLIFSAAALYSIRLFIDIDSRSHSVSDTLINWAFYLLILGVVYSIIGLLTQKKEN